MHDQGQAFAPLTVALLLTTPAMFQGPMQVVAFAHQPDPNRLPRNLAMNTRIAPALILTLAVASLPAAPVSAQDFGGFLKRAASHVKARVEAKAQEKIVEGAMRPVDKILDGKKEASPSPSPDASSGEYAAATASSGRYTAPRADTQVGDVPQQLWLNPGIGHKFDPAEGKPQIIAVNPYLAPEQPLFGTMQGMQCSADGGLVVAATAGTDENGSVSGEGWWRIAKDGAITPLASSASGSGGKVPYDSPFSVAPDGTVLAATHDEVFRIGADGRPQRIAKGFDRPGALAQDGRGNIWVADQEGCALRRIAPGGAVSTVIGADRTTCDTTTPPQDRIALGSMAWDPKHGELVTAGSVITEEPTSDMRITIWRIQPDGQARRVYSTLKVGRSPIGQNTDRIWAVAVDAQGRIHVGSRFMGAEVEASRQIMRLDETSGRLVAVTGNAYGSGDYRPGNDDSPVDGVAAHANFRETKAMCFGPDRTLFVLDEHVLRRLDTDGSVRTWAY